MGNLKRKIIFANQYDTFSIVFCLIPPMEISELQIAIKSALITSIRTAKWPNKAETYKRMQFQFKAFFSNENKNLMRFDVFSHVILI